MGDSDGQGRLVCCSPWDQKESDTTEHAHTDSSELFTLEEKHYQPWRNILAGMGRTGWLPCPSQSPRVCSDSCPLSQWYHPTISSSVGPFSSCLQCFPASGSFPMSQFFVSGGQSIGASASASVLPVNIQGWFPLGWTGLISLLSRFSRVFSSAIEPFSAQTVHWATLSSYVWNWIKFSVDRNDTAKEIGLAAAGRFTIMTLRRVTGKSEQLCNWQTPSSPCKGEWRTQRSIGCGPCPQGAYISWVTKHKIQSWMS